MLKRTAVLLITGTMFGFGFSQFANASAQSEINRGNEGLTGKVIEILAPTTRDGRSLGDDFWGYTEWAITPGTYVKGPVYDDKGNIIKEGDILIKCDTQFYDYKVDGCKADLLSAKGVLEEAKHHLDRCEGLVKTNAMSKRERDEAHANYYKAKGAYERAIADLKFSEYMQRLCTIKAPFDGYVEEVYTTPGSMANLDLPSYDTAVKLRRLSPLYVELDIDRETAMKIKNQKLAVSVYSNTLNEAVGVLNSRIQITENGIQMPIENRLIENEQNDNGNYIVHDLLFATKYENDEDALAVPKNCIHTDKDGDYVWTGEGQKLMQPGENIADEFMAKKVYITKGNEIRQGFIEKMVKLTDSGTLEYHDVILNDVPENLQDGDMVSYQAKRTLFWPGDEVKVTLT